MDVPWQKCFADAFAGPGLAARGRAPRGAGRRSQCSAAAADAAAAAHLPRRP